MDNAKLASDILKLAKDLIAINVSLGMFKGLERQLVGLGIGEDSEWEKDRFKRSSFRKSGVMAGFSGGRPAWIAFRKGGRGEISLYEMPEKKILGWPKAFKSIERLLDEAGIPLGDIYTPAEMSMPGRRRRRNETKEDPSTVSSKAFLGYILKKIGKIGDAASVTTKSDVSGFFMNLSKAVTSRDSESARSLSSEIRDTLNNKGHALKSIAEAVHSALGGWGGKMPERISLDTVKRLSKEFDQALTGVDRW